MPEEYHEYTGDFTYTVTDGERGRVLRFLRGDKVLVEIKLSHVGALRLAADLLGKT